ncbi:NosR/NirI family protein [Pseudohongiella sp.]|uniref:4Fe-4S ferredoxin-type domain-containing protein n=1 Tax=marine sediment metagenome TaxID=412755 RepID=A0A0F9Y4Y1_9ZZZZ|nr:4Fe-4S binding protein [Pseudohongiella sp.]HDZ10213.1 4Fe-4S binding protein [Pseudohongiella sp.]HEA63969.1 4Fe-4S binding protein [Pseudohongiella sp.]
MKRQLIAGVMLLCLLFVAGTVGAQTPFSSQVNETQLKEVMPAAERFSDKAGTPPVFTAFKTDPASGDDVIVGYVFQTSDLPPEEIGFSSTIDVLVGLDPDATVTAIKVLDYNESFLSSRGDFLSIRPFQEQFRRKPLSDPFRVGRDIDGVSRATITSWATSRGVYNAARRVAQAYLAGSGFSAAADTANNTRAHLAPLSWQDMQTQGLVQITNAVLPDDTMLTLSFAYMGNEVLGETLVGNEYYSRAERDASSRFDEGRLMLVGIGGNASDPFRQERLSIQQGDAVYPMPRRQTVYAGSADQGKIAGQANFAVAMILDPDMDLSQPFTVLYDPQNGQQPYSTDIQLRGIALDLALGREVRAPGELAMEDMMQASAGGLLTDINWVRVLPLLLIFTLVMASFLRKDTRLRWLTLSITLFYLGFVNGGFLSVSHITNTIKLGPSMILSDLPLLMIVVFTLITTLIWGRVFCSSLCPFGALQDMITRITPRRWQRTLPAFIHDKALYLKYAILALIVIMALVQSDISIFQYFEPFGTLFFYSTSIALWTILILILLASAVVKRFYCRYMCPLGAALGVMSLISLRRIRRVPQCTVCKVCEHACPTGAIRNHKIDFKECVRCDICESKLLEKAGVCRHSVASLTSRGVQLLPVSQVD